MNEFYHPFNLEKRFIFVIGLNCDTIHYSTNILRAINFAKFVVLLQSVKKNEWTPIVTWLNFAIYEICNP